MVAAQLTKLIVAGICRRHRLRRREPHDGALGGPQRPPVAPSRGFAAHVRHEFVPPFLRKRRRLLKPTVSSAAAAHRR
jgi:hypothetical protein